MWILVIYAVLYLDNPVIESISGYKSLENCNDNANVITEMMRQVKVREKQLRIYHTCVYQE